MWLISAKFESEGGCKCNYTFVKSVKWQLSKKRAHALVLLGARQAQLIPVNFAAAWQWVNVPWSAWQGWS